MSAWLPDVGWPDAAAGALLIALAGIVLSLNRGRLNRALALMLAVRGLESVAFVAFANEVRDVSVAAGQVRAVVTLAFPFTVAYFALAYREWRGAGKYASWWSWALAGGAVGTVAVYLAWPQIYLAPAAFLEPTEPGPLSVASTLVVALPAFLVLPWIVDVRRLGRTGHARGLWLATMAVSLEGAYWGAFYMSARTKTLATGEPLNLTPYGWISLSINLAALGIVLGAVALMWAGRKRPGHAHLGGWSGLWLALVALPVLAATGIALALAGSARSIVGSATDGVFAVAMAAGLAYSIGRLQVFDLRARLRIVGGGALVAVTIAAVAALAGLVSWRLGAPTNAWFAVAAVAAAGLAFWRPLHMAARHAVGRLSPGVAASNVLLDARKHDVYRAAVEASLARDGQADTELLRGLRRHLQLTDEQAAAIGEAAIASAGLLRSRKPRLPRFRILRRIGGATAGDAYLAIERSSGARVVVKAPAGRLDAKGAARLVREAQIIRRLNHPCIVPLIEVVPDGGHPILVFEYQPGGDLQERLRRGPLPPAEVQDLADRILSALEAGHRRGIVHRDVKPGNILFGAEGRAMLADFGIAREPASSGMTRTLVGGETEPGTLRYMSPEQARGDEPGNASDVYSTAAVLYEAASGQGYLDLTGRPEFEARRAILTEAPRFPVEGIGPELQAILARALAKNPAKRFQSAEAMRKAMLRFSLPSPRRERSPVGQSRPP